jgi:regulator of PEP synthase PpsR (kinase-PPPase family)
MFDSMTSFFDRKPIGKITQPKLPNTRRALSDSYFRRIEAGEYSILKCDNGGCPELWQDADVVLLGVSRTGKTPLSVVISHTMGLKVANMPLLVDTPPPPQLFEIDPRRVFCLLLEEGDLRRIRENRLTKEKEISVGIPRESYADPNYLTEDITNARQLCLKSTITQQST